MNKKEIQAKVTELLLSGVTKSDVFDRLEGEGVKKSQLAYFIAAHADPYRCSEHDGKVNVIVTLMFIQALLAFVLGFGIGIGAKIGPNARWIAGALTAAIPLLFAWGFYRHRVWAYNAYILLTIIQLPKSFSGFSAHPVTVSIAFAIGAGMLAFIWYVREKIFPDFAFISPKKLKGRYVFAD